MPKKYPQLSLREFEEILNTFEVVEKRTRGGHNILTIKIKEKEVGIVYQTHIDPVPLLIIKNTIKNLGITRDEFYSRTKTGAKKIGKKKRKFWLFLFSDIRS
ncbi:hypothetical protein [Marinitoga lauensis]|uniref:hypothetical protein n=1 Tax=Marinitoga lauensis TaxID=2201189 RepID=UPI0010101BB1|nr:hypothetical protein [Marinitoga lauensis]